MRGKFIRILHTLPLALLLAGCSVDSSDNLSGVPNQGLFIYLEANRHQDSDEAQIAAGVVRDGKAVNLVGGDVFKALSAASEVLLKDKGPITGSYAGTLPISNSDQTVSLSIVHEPIHAREDRWYPIDLINEDPGPGELVGLSASATFPTDVSITGPAPSTIFTRMDENIDLSWVAAGEGDTMVLRSAISCQDELSTSSYGTEIDIGDDDGLETIGVDEFIFDATVENPNLTFIADIAQTTLQELLNDLSAGKADPDFFARKIPANPAESDCEIQLFLFRQREGSFDTAFDSGSVIGSRSAEVTIQYLPNM